MRVAPIVLLGVSLAVLTPSALLAQGSVVRPKQELGVDAAFRLSFPDEGDRITAIEVPLSRVRLGTYIGHSVLFEVGGGYTYAKEGDRSSSNTRAEIALSVHTSGDLMSTRGYAIATGGSRWASSDGATSQQWLAGGGLGVKVPFSSAWGLRLEAAYARAFSTDDLSAAHEVIGLVGVSFYPR